MKKLAIYTLIFGFFGSCHTSSFCAQQMGSSLGSSTSGGPLESNVAPVDQQEDLSPLPGKEQRHEQQMLLSMMMNDTGSMKTGIRGIQAMTEDFLRPKQINPNTKSKQLETLDKELENQAIISNNSAMAYKNIVDFQAKIMEDASKGERDPLDLLKLGDLLLKQSNKAFEHLNNQNKVIHEKMNITIGRYEEQVQKEHERCRKIKQDEFNDENRNFKAKMQTVYDAGLEVVKLREAKAKQKLEAEKEQNKQKLELEKEEHSQKLELEKEEHSQKLELGKEEHSQKLELEKEKINHEKVKLKSHLESKRAKFNEDFKSKKSEFDQQMESRREEFEENNKEASEKLRLEMEQKKEEHHFKLQREKENFELEKLRAQHKREEQEEDNKLKVEQERKDYELEVEKKEKEMEIQMKKEEHASKLKIENEEATYNIQMKKKTDEQKLKLEADKEEAAIEAKKKLHEDMQKNLVEFNEIYKMQFDAAQANKKLYGKKCEVESSPPQIKVDDNGNTYVIPGKVKCNIDNSKRFLGLF